MGGGRHHAPRRQGEVGAGPGWMAERAAQAGAGDPGATQRLREGAVGCGVGAEALEGLLVS